METTQEVGITIHSDVATALVQSVSVTHKMEKSLIKTMVSGKPQVAKVFEHTETNDFEAEGMGDLTFSAGIADDVSITLLTGGVIFVDEFSYKQKMEGDALSVWNHKGTHYPHAA